MKDFGFDCHLTQMKYTGTPVAMMAQPSAMERIKIMHVHNTQQEYNNNEINILKNSTMVCFIT